MLHFLNLIAFTWLAGFSLVTGCTKVGTVIDPLDLRYLGEPPIRVGVTKLDLSPLLLPKWHLFNIGLKEHLDKPVSFDLMTPRQIRVHLGTGRLKFAMLSPADYSQIAPANTCEILAVPTNTNKQTYRRGLIIVSSKSPIQDLSELKDKRFHFMPAGNILNELALGALLEAEVAPADLDKGILGLQLDTHHINSLEVAKSVVVEQNVAGVIDEFDYQKWPETGGSFLLLKPSKDQVRVLSKTIRVPEGPFVVSLKTPAELTEQVRNYLFPDSKTRKWELQMALTPMAYNSFAEPVNPAEYEAYFEMYGKFHPPKPEEVNSSNKLIAK
ncbi:MAG: phosphate/phosphite/phosphonate ABC transporter substrate-binding protein [Planctomycetota bacterium]